jgi:hypothetical protein
MRRPDGGPAFPGSADSHEGHQMREYGMSLRDWFAGQALCGFIVEGNPRGYERRIAEQCYEFADAMIGAREKP